MKDRKEIVPRNESGIEDLPIFTTQELVDRKAEYVNLSPKKFNFKYRQKLFEPVQLIENGTSIPIQFNFCTDPFCPNFGNEIVQISTKGKSMHNYVMTGSGYVTSLACNIMNHVNSKSKIVFNYSSVMSNWSIAEEIKRL